MALCPIFHLISKLRHGCKLFPLANWHAEKFPNDREQTEEGSGDNLDRAPT